MRLLVLMPVVALGLAACDRPPDDGARPREVGAGTRPLPAATGTVLLADVAPGAVRQCTRSVPWGITGYWSPSAVTTREVEARLSAVVDSVLQRVPDLGADRPAAAEYYRQYVGVRRWNGRRTIYVNAFHRDYLESTNAALSERPATGGGTVAADTFTWRSTAVSVCDGGVLFFGVEYDPENGRFGRIEFNQRATGPVEYR